MDRTYTFSQISPNLSFSWDFSTLEVGVERISAPPSQCSTDIWRENSGEIVLHCNGAPLKCSTISPMEVLQRGPSWCVSKEGKCGGWCTICPHLIRFHNKIRDRDRTFSFKVALLFFVVVGSESSSGLPLATQEGRVSKFRERIFFWNFLNFFLIFFSESGRVATGDTGGTCEQISPRANFEILSKNFSKASQILRGEKIISFSLADKTFLFKYQGHQWTQVEKKYFDDKRQNLYC